MQLNQLLLVLLLSVADFAARRVAFANPTSSFGVATELIDINSASTRQLERLPGLTRAYADRIVRGRPYRTNQQLVDQQILPAAVYAKIKDYIIAKQK